MAPATRHSSKMTAAQVSALASLMFDFISTSFKSTYLTLGGGKLGSRSSSQGLAKTTRQFAQKGLGGPPVDAGIGD